mgnify:CR=1 FL=1
MDLLHTILSFLLAIIVLVTVHEFGHFYVARLCGVRVLRFSLGFGKVLWRKYDKHGTEFSISALPLGGYVKMLDEREMDVPAHERHLAFNAQPVSRRMAIVAAGPLANLAMAIGWALLFRLAVLISDSEYAIPLARMADAGMQINAVLMMLNLLPLPPLDGGRIAVSLLPAGPAYKFAQLEPYGFPILLLLLFTGILGDILGPLVAIFRFVLAIVFGL